MSDWDHIVVSDFGDVDAAPNLSGKEKQLVAELFRSTDWDSIVWFESWLLADEEKDIQTVEGSENLAVGTVEDYSEKAIRFAQPHRRDATNDPSSFAPKTCIVWLERGSRLSDLETPQAGLGDYAP